MLVDSGKDRSVMHGLGAVMPPYKRTIDTLEISNPDLDHIGGFPFVMEKYTITQIISPGTLHDTLESYREMERIAEEKHIPIIRPKAGTVFILDKKYDVTYTILWPEGNVRDWEANASSMVGLLEYAGKKILLTGDAPKEVEDQLIATYGNSLTHLDILKVGHHGSKTSTGEMLAKWSRPTYGVISAGPNNRYGHPHQEVLDVLTSVNTQILVTATNGRIVCKIWKEKEVECR